MTTLDYQAHSCFPGWRRSGSNQQKFSNSRFRAFRGAFDPFLAGMGNDAAPCTLTGQQTARLAPGSRITSFIAYLNQRNQP